MKALLDFLNITALFFTLDSLVLTLLYLFNILTFVSFMTIYNFSFKKTLKDLKDCKAAWEYCLLDCNCFYNRCV